MRSGSSGYVPREPLGNRRAVNTGRRHRRIPTATCGYGALMTGVYRLALPRLRLSIGAELGENVAIAWFPGQLPAGAGGADALVENERVGKRAELGSRLLHRD